MNIWIILLLVINVSVLENILIANFTWKQILPCKLQSSFCSVLSLAKWFRTVIAVEKHSELLKRMSSAWQHLQIQSGQCKTVKHCRYVVYGCMKLPVYTAEGQCFCTAGFRNCNVHFPDPGQVRFLESGKAVAQKAGLACWIGPFVKFGEGFLFKHITTSWRPCCFLEVEMMERSLL